MLGGSTGSVGQAATRPISPRLWRAVRGVAALGAAPDDSTEDQPAGERQSLRAPLLSLPGQLWTAAHLPEDIADREVQSAMSLLHARGRSATEAELADAHSRRDRPPHECLCAAWGGQSEDYRRRALRSERFHGHHLQSQQGAWNSPGRHNNEWRCAAQTSGGAQGGRPRHAKHQSGHLGRGQVYDDHQKKRLEASHEDDSEGRRYLRICQNQYCNDERSERQRTLRLHRHDSRSELGHSLHRVHAIRRQQILVEQVCLVLFYAREGQGGLRRRPHQTRRHTQRYQQGLQDKGIQGRVWFHHFDDRALLRLVQQSASDGGRQSQGVPAWKCRSEPTGCDAGRGVRRGAVGSHSGSGQQEEEATRRRRESSEHEEPANDSHRRITSFINHKLDVCQLVTSSGFSCATSGFPSPSFFQSSSTSICKNSKIFARSLLSMNHNVHYASRRLSSSYCDNDKLTHTRADGSAHQVDVSGKEVTRRSATAVVRVQVTPEIMEQIRRNSLKKGDVMAVARIAGIQGAKQTVTLIPLCHQLPLTHCTVDFDIHEETCSVLITCSVSTVARTGVEMEALTGVSVAALTLYDMCKAVSHEMVIHDIRVTSKSGGKRDFSLSAPSSSPSSSPS